MQHNKLTQNIISDSTKLFEWTVDIHNEVNKLLNKPEISYTKARQIYEKSNFKPLKKSLKELILSNHITNEHILQLLRNF